MPSRNERQAELIAILRDIKAQKAALAEELQPREDLAREELGYLVNEYGQYVDDEGYARYQGQGTRFVWDTKRLNALLKEDPQGAYQWLLGYREEKIVKEALRVK